MLRYQMAQTRRVVWEPIVRARIQEQQVKEQAAQAAPASSSASRDGQEKIASKSVGRAQPKPRQRSMFRVVGGLLFIVLGFYLLEEQGILSFSQIFTSIASSITLPAWMLGIWSQVQTWWAALMPTLNQLAALPTDDPRYAAIFATVLFGILFLLMLFPLIDRLTRWLFP